MNTLLPSTTVAFPEYLTTWCILPLSNKQFPGQKRDRGLLFEEAVSMDDITESEPPPPSPLPTGVDHWEEQRRKWTKGFAERVDTKNEDVYYQLISFVTDI